MEYVICTVCNKNVKKNGLGAHNYRAHNENYVNPNTGRKRDTPSWNKGLTRSSDERIQKSREKVEEGIKSGRLKHSGSEKPRSQETKSKISETLRLKPSNKAHPGAFNFHYEKKNGEIVRLQSSYEVKVAEILDQMNISWERPKSMFYTDINGLKRRYFADFYLHDYDVYLDPKNAYLIDVDRYKINQAAKENSCIIHILGYNDLNEERIKQIIS